MEGKIISEYKVVAKRVIGDLNEEVNTLIGAGWKLKGSAKVATGSNGSSSWSIYAQTLVKYSV